MNAMRISALLALAATVTACGGGGGGGDSGSPNLGAPSGASYSIGGSASGIQGPGLVLQLNGASDLAVDVNRNFTFTSTLGAGANYQITVKSNPIGQVCAVGNATGIANANVSSVAVTCTTPVPAGPNSFKLGGTVSGLAGSGLTLQNGSQTLAVAAGSTSFVFPNNLASGTVYQVSVATQPTIPAQTCTVANGGGTIGSADITHVAISCVTPPPAPAGGLTLDQSALNFVGEEGQSVAAQTLSGSIAGATEPVIVTVTFTNRGLLGASFSLTSFTSGQLLVTPRQPVSLPAAAYNDTITVTACYDVACARPVAGSPKTVNVTYTVRAPNPPAILRLSDHGVAFASVLGTSQLRRSLVVRDSSGAASGWSAVPSAAWLTVTAAGTSGGTLQLTANPTGLSNGFHQANVAVSSSNPAITTTEIVRVGLYVSTSASVSALSAPLSNPLTTSGPLRVIDEAAHAIDPIRPLMYSTAGSTIAANHVHTGVRVGTLTVPGGELGRATVNDDGSRLYVLNYANGTVIVVDLDTMSILRSYGFPQLQLTGESLKFGRIAYARVNGQSVLLMTGATPPLSTNAGFWDNVFMADTGELIGELFGVPGRTPYVRWVVSRDGTTAYAASDGVSCICQLSRVELRANSLGNIYGKLVAATTGVGVMSLQDLATNSDGSRVWAHFSTDDFVREAAYDGSAMQWTAGMTNFVVPGDAVRYPMRSTDIEVDAYGKFFTHERAFDLRVYNTTGTLNQQWFNFADTALVGGTAGSMRMSSDGLRLIGNGRLLTIQP